MRSLWTAGILALLATTVGCATSKINFVGPSGAVLTVDNTPYHLPAQVELSRPPGAGGSTRHDVSLVATVNNRELRTKGYIEMYGFNESDMDKVAVNTCNLDEQQLA